MQRSPKLNILISRVCYVAGAVIIYANVSYSRAYFINFFSQREGIDVGLLWWGSLALSSVMAAYEAVVIGLIFSPWSWNLLLSVPEWLNKMSGGKKKLIKTGLQTIITIALLLLGICYWFDLQTTLGGLGYLEGWSEAPAPARFYAAGMVGFSELLWLCAYIAEWQAKIGEAMQSKVADYLEQQLRKEVRSRENNASPNRFDR